MPVDETSLDRIRNATFPTSRRGYDKHEVERFLARLADWLETGGGDESRSDTVKRELERVGQRTGAILAQAEESAQQIRAEAEQEARETINIANAGAEQTRGEADAYSNETRAAADAYAKETRQAAEDAAERTRAEAEEEVRETIADAEAQARRIVDEGTQRRDDIEAVIGDLVRRRDDVLSDTEELSGRLTAAVAEHRPDGSDPFAKPEELDPLEREPEEDGRPKLEGADELEAELDEAEAEA
jgi:DivIVA domain-containing protein